MKIKTKLFFLGAIILLSALLSAQDVEAQLNLQYNNKIEYKKEVYNRIRQMIRENPSADELDKLYFNLAELSTEIDRNDPQLIASYYRQVLQYNRDFTYKDVVLYNIGYYTHKAQILQNGQTRQVLAENYQLIPDSLRYSEALFKDAIYYYRRLLEEHPLSSYFPETAWRMGEIYYSIGNDSQSRLAYLRALDYYEIAARNRDSQFYYYALAGKAWTKFALQSAEEALELEYSLLNKLDSIPQLNNLQILADEAVENIAWTFSNDPDFDFSNSNIATAKLEIRLASLNSQKRKRDVMLAVADQLLKKDKPDFALALYDSISELYPSFPDVPLISRAKIDIFRNYPQIFGGNESAAQKIEDVKDQAIHKYNPLSAWYSDNKSKNILASVNFIREIIEFEEPQIFNDFLDTPSKNNYLRYRRLVNDYSGFSEFDTSQSMVKQKNYRQNLVYMSQILAQATDLPDDYIYAIKDLRDFNRNYPEHADRLNFEKNIFFCYEKLYNFASADSLALSGTELKNIDSLYISSSRRYEEILRQDINWEYQQNELARVIFKRAQFLYEQNNFDQAKTDYLAVTEFNAENEIISDALRRLAEIELSRQEYDSAERFFRQAMDYTSGYAQSEVYKNIVLVIQQKAEFLLQQKKYNLAAAEFLRLSLELEAVFPARSREYLTRAVDVYEDLGDDEKVSELLGEITSRQSTQQAVLVFKDTWQEADKLQDYQRAIKLRQNFIDQFPGTNEAFKVELQIIDIYENKLGQKEQAAQLYLNLHNRLSEYNTGRIRAENIYLNALRIYQDLQLDDKSRQLTADFVQRYPDYSLIDLNLTYSDTDDFRTNIRKLKKLKENINELFLAEDYKALQKNIDEFQQITAAMNVDSLRIDFSEDFILFDKYQEFAEFHNRFKLNLSNIENVFLLKNPAELIPVNSSTRWQQDLAGNAKAFDELMRQCDDFRNQIMQLLQNGSEFQLQTPDYTHAIWAIAAAYDHAYVTVDQQVSNFVAKSDQVNRPELQNNEYLRSELKRRLIAEGKEYSFEFKLAAARFYQNLLYQFYDNSSYSDLWTRKSLTRLNEWGIRDAAGNIAMLDEKLLLAEESYANEEITQEYNEIFALYQNRRYSEAQPRFMNFISSYPGHNLTYLALYFAGECYYNMGQLSQAREILEKVIDFEREKTPDALLRLGHCYNSMGKEKDAYSVWNRLIEQYPDHYLAEVIKLTFDQLRQKEEEKLAALTDKKQEKVSIKYRNYVQLYKKGSYSSAQKGFASLIRKYPEHPLAYSSAYMQAEAAFQNQEFDKAIDLYQQLTAQEGNKKVNSLYRLGQIADLQNDNNLRDYYWQMILDDYPDHYLAGVVSGGEVVRKAQIVTSRPPAEKPARSTAQHSTSNANQIQYKKALMAYRYSDYQMAIAGFEKFQQDNPEHRLAFNARFLTADSYQMLQNYDKALEIFNDLLPQSGAQRPQTLIHIAQNHIALGNNDLARSVLQEVKITYSGTFEAAQANKLLRQLPGDNYEE